MFVINEPFEDKLVEMFSLNVFFLRIVCRWATTLTRLRVEVFAIIFSKSAI